ncbi:MAG: ketoacyl-ACP synthase III [Flavobacteriales bacterium]|nr:ketoacyl-ACP synthase III [Flavobacteriales bacterium]
MAEKTNVVIAASGHFLPDNIIPNEAFLNNSFYYATGERMTKSNKEIITKFYEITEIEERRYADDTMVASDMGFIAAERALSSSGTDPESLDAIIVAHNFGDVVHRSNRSDMVPSLAARIKLKLGIENPFCVAYDIPFGCPGWLQAMIQGSQMISNGQAKKVMVIGTETLSRVSDPHDIDSMLYSDGAGAVILNGVRASEDENFGVLNYKVRSDTKQHCELLKLDRSYNQDHDPGNIYLKMNGRKLYEYALNNVPNLVMECMEMSGIALKDVKKVLMHQANAKMNKAILLRLFQLYGQDTSDESVMPLTISKLGNNSVATLPILWDLLQNNQMEDTPLVSGDICVISSVGAGMNINALTYRMP